MDEELVPELGDLVTFVTNMRPVQNLEGPLAPKGGEEADESTEKAKETGNKMTTGRIIYRDGGLIRIRPVQSSHTGVDFPLDPETGQFLEILGVQEILIHEKRKDPHFSKQLGVVPGEMLEFFSAD